MRVVLSARAEAELQAIFEESVARWGETRARQYAKEIDRRLSLIANHKTQGRARPELGATVRSIPVGAHIIFLDISGDEALVLSIRHAKRRQPTQDDFT